MRSRLTITVWTVSLLALLVAGAIVTLFVTMAVGMDPTDIVTNGVEPWSTAAWACAGFAGLVVTTALSLRLWHTLRFKPLALALVAIDVGLVVWAGVAVYAEYL